MEKLQFEIDINAPASKVFNAITEKKLYEQWTATFNPTSTFEGGWNKGDKILFVGVNEEGKRGGMVSRIAESIPNKQISIQHLGFVNDQEEITEGPAVAQWANAMEEYFLEEKNGTTHFRVLTDITPEYKEEFSKMWPKALAKLKEIAEKS